MECISKTASHTARFVLAIAANLLVYIALLALLNALLAWAGGMIGIEQLSFNVHMHNFQKKSNFSYNRN